MCEPGQSLCLPSTPVLCMPLTALLYCRQQGRRVHKQLQHNCMLTLSRVASLQGIGDADNRCRGGSAAC